MLSADWLYAIKGRGMACCITCYHHVHVTSNHVLPSCATIMCYHHVTSSRHIKSRPSIHHTSLHHLQHVTISTRHYIIHYTPHIGEFHFTHYILFRTTYTYDSWCTWCVIHEDSWHDIHASQDSWHDIRVIRHTTYRRHTSHDIHGMRRDKTHMSYQLWQSNG